MAALFYPAVGGGDLTGRGKGGHTPITLPWLTNQSAELECLFYSNVISVSCGIFLPLSAGREARSSHGGKVE